jgi:tetratricopeptide (TPR) repeat protein
LEEDPLKKADMYYELGLVHYSLQNDYIKSRAAARNAISNNPNHGKSYLLIGKVYAAGGRNCGETPLERKILNCLIVDQFIKARNADPNVASEANDLIGRYSASFPKTEELFWENMAVGQSFTIGCWINETTTIRASE